MEVSDQNKPVRKPKKIPLMECFGPTIQGEGAMIGVQTYFLRFGLCDYKCKMCDSMHAVDPQAVRKNGRFLTQEEILKNFIDYRTAQGGINTTNWVTLSGGNPAIHDLEFLVRLLQKAGMNVSVETQGTKTPTWLHAVDDLTVSPKGPGMGETTILEDLDYFMEEFDSHKALSIKIVVFDERDLEFARMIAERYPAVVARSKFFLSLGNPYPPPVDGDSPINGQEHANELVKRYKVLYEDIQRDSLLSKVKFLPQWHVFVWGNAQGH